MVLRKMSLFLITGLVVLASCKKIAEQSPDTPISPDECVQRASVNSGEIVEGQYIVAYKSSPASARGISAQKLKSIDTEVLAKYRIAQNALKQSFAGGRHGGFIARLSAEEANR